MTIATTAVPTTSPDTDAAAAACAPVTTTTANNTATTTTTTTDAVPTSGATTTIAEVTVTNDARRKAIIKFASPLIVLISFMLTLISTFTPWWTSRSLEETRYLGLFNAARCMDGSCRSIVGTLAVLIAGLFVWRGSKIPRLASFGLLGSTFILSFLPFLAMCFAVMVRTGPFYVEYYRPEVTWEFTHGFVMVIVGWVMAALSTAGTLVFYRSIY
ncbi:hypothetical protein BC829DRAFT_410343 [Chytridium lagenaria]|nr:hypothetical protein BC829DRAFT_410343 [Chytridium lagenaria]